jgi:peptide chain release factor
VITKKKWDRLRAKMASLSILEADIVEKTISGSGKGGQKVNKSQQSIYLVYKPLDIAIKCQDDRSLELNRYLARQRLCDKMEVHLIGKEASCLKKIDALRKKKANRKRTSKKKYTSGSDSPKESNSS